MIHSGQKVPDGWRVVRLSDVTTVVNGTTPASGVAEYWNGDIVWITPVDLGKLTDRHIQDSDRHISQAGLDRCNLKLVPLGSVVLSSRAPIGHLGIATVPLCTNQGCKSFVPGADVDSEFLYYALRRSIWQLQHLGSGATFTEISKSQLEKFEIPLPPLAEQRRITAILNEQMAAVELAREATGVQMAAAGTLPTAYLRATFSRIDGGEEPAIRLGEVVGLRKEVIHPRDNPSGPAVFVGLEHVESGTGRRLGSEPVEMSELTGRKPKFYQGDIVYGYLRPYLNKVWIAEFDGLCSVDQYVYEADTKVALPSYVAWFMRSPAYLENSPVGKTPGWLPRIRTEEVASVGMRLPPIVEQKKVVAEIESHITNCLALRSAIEEEAIYIEKYPAVLLRKAFAGAMEN